MSKKWITFLVAAVVGVLVLAPAAANATCVVQVLGRIQYSDKTAAAGTLVNDPIPLPGSHAVDFLAQAPVAATGVPSPTPAVAPFGLQINQEGTIERLSDILIYDGLAGGTQAFAGGPGTGFCFNAGNIITVTFNGVLTSPAVGTALNQIANMDVYDSNGIGGLSVSSATVGQAFAANTTQTIITITIGAPGTTSAAADQLFQVGAYAAHVGAALRLKNLRIDATSVTGGATVTLSASQGTTTITTFTPNNIVGTKAATITSHVDPAVVAGAAGSGTQSSNAGLKAPDIFSFVEGFTIAAAAGNNSFRLAGGTCSSATAASDTCVSQVSQDIATTPTSLEFWLTGIPSGVTVTFPAKIDTTKTNGTGGMTFTLTARNGSTATNSGAPGNLLAIYDTTAVGTTAANFTTAGGQVIETADNADSGTLTGAGTTNPNCTGAAGTTNLNAGSLCDSNPKVGVKVGATSAAGTATLTVAFGPGDPNATAYGAALFTGDDVSASIPRYSTTAGRTIVSKKAYFTIAPTTSTLLFPFVSTVGGFNTGLAVVNTCADAGVFAPAVTTATCVQQGGVTFYFFGKDQTGTVITGTLNTDLNAGGKDVSGVCRGYDKPTGRLLPGTTGACAVSTLIPLVTWASGTAPTTFDGYVLAVASFQNAHGFSAQFNAALSPFSANNALVIVQAAAGGRTAGAESLGE